MPRRDDPQPGLGMAIRKLRETAGYTQESLGERSDIHPTWISHIESGRINPTWGNVKRIAGGLGISIIDLAKKAEAEDKRFERLLGKKPAKRRRA